MSIIWTYGAGIATILLAFFSLVEDFYLNKNRKRRIGMSVGLLVATVITMISIRGSDRQHTEDEGKITGLQQQISGLTQLVQSANNTEKQNTKQLSDARAADTKQFLGEFDKLSGRVAGLQTQVATTDLKSEAQKLQADLESTRKAMQPDKAVMGFSLDNRLGTHTAALKQVNGITHVSFTVYNASDADALDGYVIITLCDACKFKTEPPGSIHINGAPENQRNIPFQQSLANTSLPRIEFDVETPDFPFQMAVVTGCHTCVQMKRRVFSSDLATIYASNPQAKPSSKFPTMSVHPFLK